MAGSDGIVRAGLSRRAVAFVIDALLVQLLLEAVAALAFASTGGFVQMSGGIGLKTCTGIVPPRAPPGTTEAARTTTTSCTSRLLVFPIAADVTVEQEERPGFVRKTTRSIDAQGRPIQALDISDAVVPLLIWLRWLFDCGPGTPGRRLCHIWLVPGNDIGDAHGRAARGRFGRRYLVIFATGLVTGLALWLATPLLQSTSAGVQREWLVFVGSAILVALPVAAAAFAVLLRRDAYYDRLAGTHVVPG